MSGRAARYGMVLLADAELPDAGERLSAVLDALADAAWAVRIAVVGCDAAKRRATIEARGWSALECDGWRLGCASAMRVACRALPLVDAFFVARLDTPILSRCNAVALAPLSEAYVGGRIKLLRIVIPTIGGADVMPWLIDIGFRQPFVELADDAALEAVLEANASQVARVPFQA